jgi:hypothetical protein
MMDLPIAQDSFAQNESLTTEIFDPSDFALKTVHDCVVELPPSVVDILVGCAKFIERTETNYDKWDVAVFVVFRFEPFWAVGEGCEECQKAVVSTCRGGGLTLEDIGHLVQPPGYVSDEERWWLSSRLCLLIVHSLIVDACHMAVLMHQLVNRFGIKFWYCVGLRGSVGIWKVHATNATQRAGACAAEGGRESGSRVLWQFSLCPVC